MSVLKFFNHLFDPHEQICVADQVTGVAVMPLTVAIAAPVQFFSINPLKDSRKDTNVTRFRNILLEFDDIAPDAQLAEIAKIPHTSVVWSGGKSYHCIISLENPCFNKAEYDALVARIYAKVPNCDKSTKNASRLSRVPEAVRDNGNKQTLIYIDGRVPDKELSDWLGPAPILYERPPRPIHSKNDALLPDTTRHYLAFGSAPGKRNDDLFRAACDLARAGYNYQEVLEMVEGICDLSLRERVVAVQSAFKTVRGQF